MFTGIKDKWATFKTNMGTKFSGKSTGNETDLPPVKPDPTPNKVTWTKGTEENPWIVADMQKTQINSQTPGLEKPGKY
jgi:hypothetical protein